MEPSAEPLAKTKAKIAERHEFKASVKEQAAQLRLAFPSLDITETDEGMGVRINHNGYRNGGYGFDATLNPNGTVNFDRFICSMSQEKAMRIFAILMEKE